MATPPFFDEDLYDFAGAASQNGDGAESAVDSDETSVLPDEPHQANGAGPEQESAMGSSADGRPRRKRGSRGGAGNSKEQKESERRWRSGAIPPAPMFDGDVEANPYCLRHYRRRLRRWVRLTQEYLPANEQALRALEQLRGDAELEFEEVDDSRFDHPEGIQRLLDDLEVSFGERELFRQGGVIREFESVGRMQGESITAFIRRFRLLERRLVENKVPMYPEATRVIKLLDGLRLDEKSTASVLLAAGNRYDMARILEALRIQYPPGMSVTGLPKGLATLSRPSSRASSSRASTFRSSTTSASTRRSRGARSNWKQWHTEWEVPEEQEEVPDEEVEAEEYQGEELDYEIEPNEELDAQDYDDEELIPEIGEGQEADGSSDMNALLAAAEALTVTSKRLAGLVQARGFYQVDGKSKGKGKNSAFKKGKGKSKSGSKGANQGAKSAGKGGKKGLSRGLGKGSGDRQARLHGSACLGCGATDHWVRDCPHVNNYQAQLATADVELDAEGYPVCYMMSVAVEEDPVGAENPVHSVEKQVQVFSVPRPPSIMLSTCSDASFLIADTGCQRQVAGTKWHEQHMLEIQPLKRLRFPEVCRFSFGPADGVPSLGRYLYPAGIAGELVALGISEIDSPAPGLLSRPTMEALGAVPDILEGKVYFRALGGRSTRLYLSPCRHLALKIDEWPEHISEWPVELQQLELIYTTQQAVLHYSAASLKPRLKDRILELFMEPCTAVTMMTTQAAMAAAAQLQLNHYAKNPDNCRHPSGTRTYTAAGMKIQICDTCGSRWVVMPTGGTVEATPKANPNAKTPLDLSDAAKSRLQAASKAAVKGKANGAGRGSASWSQPSSGSSRAPSQAIPQPRMPPPPPTATSRVPVPTQTPKAYQMNGQQPPRRPGGGQRSVSEVDTLDDTSDNMSVTSRLTMSENEAQRPRVRQWQGTHRGQGLGLRRAQPLRNPNEEEPAEWTAENEATEFHDYMMDRAQDPDYWDEQRSRDDWDEADMARYDRGCFAMKKGTRKRLAGAAKLLWQEWNTEAKVYQNRAKLCRAMRRHKVDLVEIYGGHAAITEFALKSGLKTLQPVDQIYGIQLDTSEDFQALEAMLERWLPALVVWEISCTLWSNLQYLNRSQDELQELRARELRHVRSMAKIIHRLAEKGVHFLVENPYGTAFWEQPPMLQLRTLPNTMLKMGCMCAFGLTDNHGMLLKKPTGWLSNMPELLDELALPCTGDHEHGRCLGGDIARKAQVYTDQLARACVRGLIRGLTRLGDERWCKNYLSQADMPHSDSTWTSEVNYGDSLENFEAQWEPPGEHVAGVYFLDINRHVESWRPLLKEAEGRLQNITTSTITLKPSPFVEKVRALVPWDLQRVQLSKAPKQRRLPDEVLMNGAKHRGAALWCNDEEIRLEAEEIKSIVHAPAGRYEKPIRVGIYFYGVAPSSSLNPKDDAAPEPPRLATMPEEVETTDRMLPHQPGYRDISFPGIELPQWVQQVLRRLHCNLGHPPKEVLVRQLTLANASDVAVKGARHLRCEVCLRVAPPHQPRTVKAFQPKRFNDRLCIDILYIKDLQKRVYMYLNCVDDATSYQAASYLGDRSEDSVVKNLLNGWFTFFGPPDEMTVDAEGAFRGMRFESLHAQLNVDIRVVPPDAHWQLGKAERHGQALKWNAARLISQFAATNLAEVNLCVAMAVHAKNTLIRRSGSSPSQWVFGRNPKLPASLLSDGGSIESCQLTSDSDRLQQIEAVRTQAMMNHHQFEAHAALRAALLRKSRPYRGQLFPGQKVAYFRLRSTQFDGEGSVEGYRQGIVLALDRNPSSNLATNVWIRNSRGRVVQCAPEQVRPVFGAPNVDQDLAAHPRAFRAPLGNHPRPAGDLRVLQDVNQTAEEARPVDEASPAPVLDAQGQPVEPAMLNPILMMPPTPRSSPATPSRRPRERSRSAARAPRPLTSVPEEVTVPRPETSLPPDRALHASGPPETSLHPDRALHASGPPETSLHPDRALHASGSSGTSLQSDRALPGDSIVKGSSGRRSAEADAVSGTGSPPVGPSPLPSRDLSRQVSKQESSSGMTQELERLISEEYPELRGIKRQSDIPTDLLSAEGRPVPAQPSAALPEAEFLLVFCQRCGEQPRGTQKPTICARCSCSNFVDSPKEVTSWFDEIKEREAFDRLLPGGNTTGLETKDLLNSFPSRPQDTNDEEVAELTAFSSMQFSCKPLSFQSVHRLDVLRRHARGEHLRYGWDGTPAEVPRGYEHQAFLTAAHYFGHHSEEETSPSEEPHDTPVAKSPPRARPPSLSEAMAKRLLQLEDFRHVTCHQLLDTVKFLSKDTSKRQSHSPAQSDSGTLTLGLYSHGSQTGLTTATSEHATLIKYLVRYLQHHGMDTGITSIHVSKNIQSRPHRDCNNAENSLNWHISLGNFSGGQFWVESSATNDDSRSVVTREVNGKMLPGYLSTTRNRLVSFGPKQYHYTEAYQGERYAITAYETRLFKTAEPGLKRQVRKLGLPTPRACRAWLEFPAYEAYPAKVQSSACGEGETLLAMESSESEGNDGTFETRRAAKQARKKEVPWQSMTPEEVPEFVKALQQEWSEWERWSSCKPIWVREGEVAAHLILRSRVCYRWKPIPDGQKPKARIVVLGFRDPHLPWLARDAPVLSRSAFHLMLQWAASRRVKLHNADCKSAFLQGDPDVERPENIYMRPPQDPVALEANPDWRDSRLLYLLTAPVYGQANAPRQWYEHVVRVLLSLGWSRHTLDPCLFLWRQKDEVVAVLGIHVDDLIAGALPDYQSTLKDVEKSFTWGSPWVSGEFTFVGRHIKQWPDGSITIDQSGYVNEVPTTKVKLSDDTKLSDHADLVTEFRSGIGSLQWLAGTTRGDIAADVSLIQRSPQELTVGDLKEVNGVLRYVRATNDAYLRIVPTDFSELILVCYGDAGWANAPGHKSQGGLVIVATDKKALGEKRSASLLEWKSYRHQRILRSTLAAEAASLDKAFDHGNYMAMMLSEMMDGGFLATMNERPLCEVLPVTDARSLWDSIHRLTTNFQEKRVEIDVAALRQCCKGLRWVPTESQIADALTKRSRTLRDQFRQWMASPFVTLVDSKQPSDVVTGGDANRAWRA
ncbi:RE1 [Symbiodinium natans]|uniref:RE1 protein n=1 Tax=Symbiodinium natans TaxID=878477 RepID=A0A812LAC3_9DINO|nr:RE1 [Symbiodinium natans]